MIKLTSFGISIQGSVNTYGDNNAMVKDTLESTLSKKLNLINYRIVRKSVATKMTRIAKEDTETFTKLLHTNQSEHCCNFSRVIRMLI